MVVGVASKHNGAPRSVREVDDNLGALGRPQQDLPSLDRLRHQPAVGGDLDQGRAVGEVQVVGAKVGGDQEAQPVAPRRDTVVGEAGAIDQHDLARDPVVGWAPLVPEGVGELVAAVE